MNKDFGHNLQHLLSKLLHKTENQVTKCTAYKWVLPKAHNNLEVSWECLQPRSANSIGRPHQQTTNLQQPFRHDAAIAAGGSYWQMSEHNIDMVSLSFLVSG